MRVFIAGEGPTELGGWAKPVAFRGDDLEPGVIEALLLLVSEEVEIVSASNWKSVRKFRVGDHAGAEARTVLGLVLDARESACEVLAFVRDRDRQVERQQDVEDGLHRARSQFSDIPVVGGVAIEETEAWILAILGVTGSERLADAKKKLGERGVQGTAAMVRIIAERRLRAVPDDAGSLRAWIQAAAVAWDVEAPRGIRG